MKILHLITGLGMGGAEAMLTRVVTRMDATRFENVVVSLTGRGFLAEPLERAGVRVHTLGMRNSGRFMAWQPGRAIDFWRLLRREKPDILQTWLYHADLLGLLAGRYAGLRRIIWNVRCSDLDASHYSRLFAGIVRLHRHYAGFADVIVTNAQAALDVHVARGYDPSNWQIIPNGVDLDDFRPDPDARRAMRARWGLNDGDFVVGMVARYDPHKRHDLFVDAARRFSEKAPGARFVLVGPGMDGSNPAMARLAAQAGLGGKLILAGPIRDVRRAYPAFDLGVLSSWSEGFPNVIAECMAAGVPCVATDAGDSARVVGAAGFIVPRGDGAALAQGIGRFWALPPETRRALGAAARDRIGAHFSIAAAVRGYERLYDRQAPLPTRPASVGHLAAAT